jgi:hypothetical protein
VCIGAGWWLAFEGYSETEPDVIYQVTYPIGGWISMVIGTICIIGGTLWSAFGHKKWMDKKDKDKK